MNNIIYYFRFTDDSYKTYFAEAVERTTRFQINTPIEDLKDFGKTTTSYVSPENQIGVGLHIYKSLGGFTADDITAQCIKYSLLSKPLIDEYLGIKTILTVGYIIDKGHELFKFRDSDIINMMNQTPEKHQNKKAGVHVWLTLPSFEIFDLTYRESKNAIANNPFNSERGFDFIFNSLESLYYKQQLAYVPMLVGEDSLFKLNLVKQLITEIEN